MGSLFAAAWLGGCLFAVQDASPAAARAAADLAPSDRLGEGWWARRHAEVLANVAAHPDPQVVMIGDSITNNYDKANPPDEDFQPTWNAFYAPRGALDLGFSGDTTSNVLWRLQHGEVEGLNPKVVVLLIGTNDTGTADRSGEEAERGIDAVVADLVIRLPETRILLVGVLPSAVSPEKTAKDEAVNRYLAASYTESPRVTYLDIGSIFLTPEGALDVSVFYHPRLPQHLKPLHPDTRGQRRMAETIEPTLAHLLGGPPRVPPTPKTGMRAITRCLQRLNVRSRTWL